MTPTQRESIAGADASTFFDVSRSVDQLCTQLSLSNVNVPKFNGSEIFDFIAEYELATTTLTDEQKLILLAKAFPTSRYKSWFEDELKPLIERKSSWANVKKKLIERFSDTEDNDRHLIRLRELKFNPETGQRLLDFVEDLIYSHKKAYPEVSDPKYAIRFVKASIPSSLKSALGVLPDFKDATTFEMLKKAARQYDSTRAQESSPKASDRVASNELAQILKEIMKGIQKEGEATRGAFMAAFKPSVTTSPDRKRYEDSKHRDPSPHGSYRYSNHHRRSPSPGYKRRSPSPHGYPRDYKQNRRKEESNESVDKITDKSGPFSNDVTGEAYNSEVYFKRFGRPPKPCGHCNSWHWNRHCPEHLN